MTFRPNKCTECGTECEECGFLSRLQADEAAAQKECKRLTERVAELEETLKAEADGLTEVRRRWKDSLARIAELEMDRDVLRASTSELASTAMRTLERAVRAERRIAKLEKERDARMADRELFTREEMALLAGAAAAIRRRLALVPSEERP